MIVELESVEREILLVINKVIEFLKMSIYLQDQRSAHDLVVLLLKDYFKEICEAEIVTTDVSQEVPETPLRFYSIQKIEEKKDSRNKTDGREIIGGRMGPENAPAQKTTQEDKDTDKDTNILNEQGGQTDTSS